MAKRFSDTDLWDKEWFMGLTPKLKCLVQFIFSKCDQAGVWSPNWVLATSFIGEKVSADDLTALAKHFEFLQNGKIYVCDFIKFQYGVLTEKCAPHKKVIALLKNHGLYERVLLGYQYPTDRVQEKEEDKEVDKDSIVVVPAKKENLTVPPLAVVWNSKPSAIDVPLLPDVTITAIRQRQWQKGNKNVKPEDVLGYWETWLPIEITGDKFYATANEVYKHFSNRCEKITIVPVDTSPPANTLPGANADFFKDLYNTAK